MRENTDEAVIGYCPGNKWWHQGIQRLCDTVQYAIRKEDYKSKHVRIEPDVFFSILNMKEKPRIL